MIKRQVVIQVTGGLEARPIAMLVQIASQFESEIYIESEEKRVNAKSIMGMMTLGLIQGEKVTLSAEGIDEKDAVDSMEQYLSQR